MMHFLMMISDKPDMVFRLELMMRSIIRFAPTTPQFTVVVNGEQKTGFPEKVSLSPWYLDNTFVSSVADVYQSPQHWSLHVPSRWFLPAKSDQCVMIDVDVIAIRDLTPLFSLDPNSLHGVAASKPIPLEDWIALGHAEILPYFNFGMVVVPGRDMPKIGQYLMDNIPRIKATVKHQEYFAGQIGLSLALRECGVQTNTLDRRFNWYDDQIFPEESEILLLHYFLNQYKASSLSDLRANQHNEYLRLILKVADSIYRRKIF